MGDPTREHPAQTPRPPDAVGQNPTGRPRRSSAGKRRQNAKQQAAAQAAAQARQDGGSR